MKAEHDGIKATYLTHPKWRGCAAPTRLDLVVWMLIDERRLVVRIKVEYDAYLRTLKFLDREFGSALDDGGVYELEVPLIVPVLRKMRCSV